MLTFPANRLLYNRDEQCESCIGWQESPSSTAGADIPTMSFDMLMKFNLVGAMGAKHTENPAFCDVFKSPNFRELGPLHHLKISGNGFAVTLSGLIC